MDGSRRSRGTSAVAPDMMTCRSLTFAPLHSRLSCLDGDARLPPTVTATVQLLERPRHPLATEQRSLTKGNVTFGLEVLEPHTTDTGPNTLAWIHRPRRMYTHTHTLSLSFAGSWRVGAKDVMWVAQAMAAAAGERHERPEP